jgi:hypothetical protein
LDGRTPLATKAEDGTLLPEPYTAGMATAKDYTDLCRCMGLPPSLQDIPGVSAIMGGVNTPDAIAITGQPYSQRRRDFCWSRFFQKGAQGAFDPAAKKSIWRPAGEPVLAPNAWLTGAPDPCKGVVGSCYDASYYETQAYVQRGQQRLQYTEKAPLSVTTFPVDAPGLPDPIVTSRLFNTNRNALLPGRDASSLHPYSETDNPYLNWLLTSRQAQAKITPLMGLGAASAPLSATFKTVLAVGGVLTAGAVVYALTKKGK